MEKTLIALIAFFAVLGSIAALVGCGYEQKKGIRVQYEDGTVPGGGSTKAYTWDEIKAACGTCHNSSAPAIPIGDEKAFKASAKVKARISNGTMPPTAGSFDKARALAYIGE